MMQKKILLLCASLPFLLGTVVNAEDEAEVKNAEAEAAAEEVEKSEDAADADPAEKKENADDDDDDDEEETEDEKDELFNDDAPKTAEDMKEKMADLMQLLKEKDSALPGETKEQLQDLLEQLKKLGVSADDLAKLGEEKQAELTPEELNTPSNLIKACSSMASTFYGLKRKDEKIAEYNKIKSASEPKEIADVPLMHLIVACVDDLTTEELQSALKNKYRRMPKRISDQLKNKDADLPGKARDLTSELFDALQIVAEGEVNAAEAKKAAMKDRPKKKPQAQNSQVPHTEMPGWVSVGALLLFFGTVALLMYKFSMMQSELNAEGKKAKKDKKKK